MSAPQSSSQPTILIVDDEPDLREAIAFEFERKKFHVLLAGNGREAFDIVSRESVDVVLSDVRMPNGDGIELLERVKARNAFKPIVMLVTGFADITLEEAYDKGADAVFAKPFDRQVLLQTVQRAVQPTEQRLLRKGSRVEAEIPVGIRFPASGFSVEGEMTNVGRGGMFAALRDRFPALEEKAEFRIQSSADPELTIEGEGVVRWVRKPGAAGYPPGCGIEFTGFDNPNLSRMLELINFLKTKALIPRT